MYERAIRMSEEIRLTTDATELRGKINFATIIVQAKCQWTGPVVLLALVLKKICSGLSWPRIATSSGL
jgi:hypothetical protein